MKHKNKILIKFILYIMVIVILPIFVRTQAQVPKKIEALVIQIETIQPDYVFIGNSMLDSRIDASYFETITGKKCFLIWKGGVVSSFWYLILKNVISVSEIEPECVFIFFRDTYLTEPLYRIDGEYKTVLDEYKTSSETVFDTISSKSKEWDEALRAAISDLYTFSNVNERARNAVPKISRKFTKFISQRFSSDFSRSDINQIFKIENFRPIADDGESISEYQWNYNFQDAIDNSFLPHMIDVMKKTRMKFCFIRVQKRPGRPLPLQDQLLLNQYQEDLEAYINSNGYQLYDFTGHPEITLDMYGVGDHIDWKSKQKYTQLFIDTMGKMIQ